MQRRLEMQDVVSEAGVPGVPLDATKILPGDPGTGCLSPVRDYNTGAMAWQEKPDPSSCADNETPMSDSIKPVTGTRKRS